MELRQLRQFLALAETKNFHRAAESLHMAQPPLSVSIRKLEEELGVSLAERHARGVTLTPEGELVATQAREIVRLATELRQFAKEAVLGARGTLSVGFVVSATYDVIPRLIPVFRSRYPNVELRLREASTHEIIEGLNRGDLDVGLVRTPLAGALGVGLTPLFSETMLLAVRHGHRFESRSEVELAELRDEPLILFPRSAISSLRTLIDFSFSDLGITPNIVEETAQVHTTMALVECGIGSALVPSVLRRAGLGHVRLVDLTIRGKPIQIGLAVAVPVAHNHRVAKTFVQVAVEVLAEPIAPSTSAAA